MPIPEYTPVIWLHGHCWRLIGLRKTSLEKRSHKASTYRSSQKWVFHVILRNYCENLMSTLDTCSGMLACCDKCHSQKHLREGGGTFRPILLDHSSSQIEVRAETHARTKAEIMEEGLSSDSVLPRPLTTFPRVPLPSVAWALPHQSTIKAILQTHGHRPIQCGQSFEILSSQVTLVFVSRFQQQLHLSLRIWWSKLRSQTDIQHPSSKQTKIGYLFTFLKNQETYVISLV